VAALELIPIPGETRSGGLLLTAAGNPCPSRCPWMLDSRVLDLLLLALTDERHPLGPAAAAEVARVMGLLLTLHAAADRLQRLDLSQ